MISTVQHKGITFQTLYNQKHIEEIIEKLAVQINSYYDQIRQKEGQFELVVVCILKGAFMFFSDLIKKIKYSIRIEFIKVKSYVGLESTGKIAIETALNPAIFQGKHILIVEDIHDTGHTLEGVIEELNKLKPRQVDTVVLVKRPDKAVHIDLKFYGLECGDFIIGYGLDFDEFGRNFPDIYQKVSKEETH